ncbi:MAG TPA: tetratricopeptide repeat protein [Vicinamibacterales bacterium]|nr:tetratricopeptide repeat protein [Vicinamibacterales bacterium]
MLKGLCIAGLLFVLAQSPPPGAEAISLLGKPLVPAPIPAETRRTLEENLKKAEIEHGKNPDDPDATIWLGRRQAYLGRYREAIETYSEGIEKHPDDARLYRHRGHRYLTVREFPKAIADFTRAAALVAGQPDQVEPDGQPNARNIPTSTLQSNIYYHLGLAHYLTGDWARAADAYARCMTVSKNPDMLVATTYWYHLALARQGRMADAARLLQPISADMEIIENASYHRLLRMFKGELTPDALLAPGAAGLDAVTTRYGIAAWHLAHGRRDAAIPLLRAVVDGAPQQWPAFGYIAAEAELSRK